MPRTALGTASRITAVYRVDLAGFNLGNFRLTTTFRGDDYEMRGEAASPSSKAWSTNGAGSTASSGKCDRAPGPSPRCTR